MWKSGCLPRPTQPLPPKCRRWPLSVCMPLIFNYVAYFRAYAIFFPPRFWLFIFFGNNLHNEWAHATAEGVNCIKWKLKKTSDKNACPARTRLAKKKIYEKPKKSAVKNQKRVAQTESVKNEM